MGDRQNRTRAAKYRELVELLLTAEEVPVRVRPTYAKLSDVFAAEEPPASDIDGLDHWAVLVRADYRHDWSGGAGRRSGGRATRRQAARRRDPKSSRKAWQRELRLDDPYRLRGHPPT